MLGISTGSLAPLAVKENFLTKQSIQLAQLVQANNLVDVYRDKNPLEREYTFHRPAKSSSKLDCVYLTKDITATGYFINPTVSDHITVGVEVSLPATLSSRVKRPKSNY